MSDPRTQTRAAMRALLARFGCLDAAAETINARLGGGTSKGTLSKKLAGQLDFTVPEVWALEDAMGHHPVTRILARRLAGAGGGMAGRDLVGQVGLIARETGEAVAAILSAGQSADAIDSAGAVVEIDEAIAALRQARDVLARGGGA